MIAAIPLTLIPLILYNALGFAMGGNPWVGTLFTIPLIGGAWAVTLSDLMILLAMALLFVETLRSANPTHSATITNHIISTGLVIIYIIEFLTVPVAATSLFFVLTIIALFDVVAGFTISIRSASRDVSFGHNDGPR